MAFYRPQSSSTQSSPQPSLPLPPLPPFTDGDGMGVGAMGMGCADPSEDGAYGQTQPRQGRQAAAAHARQGRRGGHLRRQRPTRARLQRLRHLQGLRHVHLQRPRCAPPAEEETRTSNRHRSIVPTTPNTFAHLLCIMRRVPCARQLSTLPAPCHTSLRSRLSPRTFLPQLQKRPRSLAHWRYSRRVGTTSVSHLVVRPIRPFLPSPLCVQRVT